jgi:hypothetical protein
MKLQIKKILSVYTFLSFLLVPMLVRAQSVNIDATKLLPSVEVSLSPRSGSFVEGSTFQIPVILDTKTSSINGIEIRIHFDKDKLLIVNPTGGTSIVGLWVEPPVFDNSRGTASYVGVVPGGITTESGVIGTITFKAKGTGLATVSISSNSKVLLNDGLGTNVQINPTRAQYQIIAKAPEGVQIFSETHSSQSDWYNNNNPVLSWVRDPGVDGFSFVIDDKPNTIPDNTVDTVDTVKSFESLNDGLWYFHIKAHKDGIWGTTGNFILRIDTHPPAQFTPTENMLLASSMEVERSLISFSTTDNLSGVDHYEVGVIDKNQATTQSPVFLQTDSPFQLPLSQGSKFHVIVRAIDKAGNAIDASIDVQQSSLIKNLMKNYPVYVLLGLLIVAVCLLLLHILVGHHVLRHIKRVILLFKKEEQQEDVLLTKDSNNPTPEI